MSGRSKLALASYYRARYYDAGVGRFLAEDPIGFASSQTDFYAYARNNPLYFKDPSGLEPVLGPANSKINTVICSGGRMQVQIGGPPPSQAACAEECMRTHEEQHIRDLTAGNPQVCAGAPDGVTVTFSDKKERAATEVAASLMELQCLRMKKSTAPPNCKSCNKDLLDQRIRQMERFYANNLYHYYF